MECAHAIRQQPSVMCAYLNSALKEIHKFESP